MIEEVFICLLSFLSRIILLGKSPNTEFSLVRKSLYSVRILENADQKKKQYSYIFHLVLIDTYGRPIYLITDSLVRRAKIASTKEISKMRVGRSAAKKTWKWWVSLSSHSKFEPSEEMAISQKSPKSIQLMFFQQAFKSLWCWVVFVQRRTSLYSELELYWFEEFDQFTHQNGNNATQKTDDVKNDNNLKDRGILCRTKFTKELHFNALSKTNRSWERLFAFFL